MLTILSIYLLSRGVQVSWLTYNQHIVTYHQIRQNIVQALIKANDITRASSVLNHMAHRQRPAVTSKTLAKRKRKISHIIPSRKIIKTESSAFSASNQLTEGSLVNRKRSTKSLSEMLQQPKKRTKKRCKEVILNLLQLYTQLFTDLERGLWGYHLYFILLSEWKTFGNPKYRISVVDAFESPRCWYHIKYSNWCDLLGILSLPCSCIVKNAVFSITIIMLNTALLTIRERCIHYVRTNNFPDWAWYEPEIFIGITFGLTTTSKGHWFKPYPVRHFICSNVTSAMILYS